MPRLYNTAEISPLNRSSDRAALYYTVRMAMGKRKRRARQTSMWVATQDLPRSVAHPFYRRLNRVLDEAHFDAFVEGACVTFYAEVRDGPVSRPVGIFACCCSAISKASILSGRSRGARPIR